MGLSVCDMAGIEGQQKVCVTSGWGSDRAQLLTA